MRLQRLAAVMALGLSLAAQGAGQHANGERRATELAKAAEKLYLQAKYKEAAELLKKANELDPKPVLLYNIARALDQAGDLPAALEYYRQYVASNETDPTLVKRATLSIERLRTLINKQEAAQVQADAARKKLEEETAAVQQKATDEQKRMEAERVASEQRRKIESQRDIDNYRAARTWAVVAGGAGLLAAGGGVAFGVSALQSHDAFTAAGTEAEKDALKAATQQRALLADASYGVGLALAVTAFFLFPKGPEPAPYQDAPAAAPAPAPSARFLVGPGSVGVEVHF
ncbi:MAG TPA: tetratricopeptide repeat protein [Myxococcaceae bacterium]|nr:tetratricopeptide repeat protein [Myxococcaceae bacterium]